MQDAATRLPWAPSTVEPVRHVRESDMKARDVLFNPILQKHTDRKTVRVCMRVLLRMRVHAQARFTCSRLCAGGDCSRARANDTRGDHQPREGQLASAASRP